MSAIELSNWLQKRGLYKIILNHLQQLIVGAKNQARGRLSIKQSPGQRVFLASELHTEPFCRYLWLDVSIYFNLKETLLYALN